MTEYYECPNCSVTLPWTDGIERGGNEPAQYWCQHCGAVSPLDDCPEVIRD